MNRRQVERKRRRQRKLLLSVIGIIGAFTLIFRFGLANSKEMPAYAIDEDMLVEGVKDPVLKKIDKDLEEVQKGRLEKELENLRAELIEKEKNRKVAYLTFDDGPSTKSTPAILDILKENNIKASFFILGQNASYYPEILKRIHEEGHAIGHHSYTHDYKYLYSNPDHFMAELHKTDKLFSEILGDDFSTKLMRLPGGAFGEKKLRYVDIAGKEGYVSYNWNALNGDAEGRRMSQDFLINRLKNTVGSQKQVVILMHDTNAKDTTVQSLQASIDYLRSQGYEFDKLSQGGK